MSDQLVPNAVQAEALVAAHRESAAREPAAREPIAIVGIGCRFPGGADSPARLWALLAEGFDAIGPIPADRFDAEALYAERPATPGHIMSRWGGFLGGIDQLDADFFGLSPREAERLDPQQRLLLEVAWEALEDAGIAPSRLAGTQTGVFVGLWLNDFEARLFADPDNVDLYMTTGSGRYSASGRLSYFLDLMGPSLTVDTACSSSLAAVHLACQSLRSGECTMALAGGANVILQPHITIAYSQARMMAPDGRCKFGDAAADGYVRSEGAGLVALKRLSTALADGDTIYALIRGSAVTNDGRSSGFLATPGQAGQVEMLRRAYANAGVEPSTVHYVEAHGTGTSAGDPVELAALGAVLGVGRPADQPCLVGSIKTNVGHTEGAAGVAGLIKTALALHHGQVPVSLHQQTPNPAVPWEDWRLRICTRLQPFPDGLTPARAGVSAFGIAGTNAHVVLEAQAPPIVHKSEQDGGGHLLLLSARAPAALAALATRYRALLAQDQANLGNICWSAATRREHLPLRLTVAARSPAEAGEALDAYIAGGAHELLATGEATAPPRVAFVFPGQGGQWQGMAQDLLVQEPIFREAILRCDRAIHAAAGWSPLALLESDDASWLEHIDKLQPVLFTVQVALAALWQAWAGPPDAVVGHSLGEVAAAHVAGILTLDDAAQVICHRSRLLRRVAGQGAMAVVGLSAADAEAAIADYADRVSVAVINSNQSTVISGEPGAVDAVLATLEARNVFCRRVQVDVASHSPQMEPLAAELRDALVGLQPVDGTIPFHSTVSTHVEEGRGLGAAYWAHNLRQPVRFGESIQQLIVAGCTLFVEMGPHPVLVQAIEEGMRRHDLDGAALAAMRRGADGPLALRAALGALCVRGGAVRWNRLEAGAPTPLPTYPWQRERHWLEVSAATGQHARSDHWLLGWPIALANGAHVWENRLTAAAQPLLYAHRLGDAPSVPAAAALECALAAATRAAGPVASVDIRLRRLLELVDDGPTRVQVSAHADGAGPTSVECFSHVNEAWQPVWQATVCAADHPSPPPPGVGSGVFEALRREGEPISGNAFYAHLESSGVRIGAPLRRVEWLWRRNDEILAEIAGPADAQDASLLFEPCFELAAFAASGSDMAPELWMPVTVRGATHFAPPQQRLWCHVHITVHTRGATATARVHLYDSDGVPIATIAAIEMQRLDAAQNLSRALHTLAWLPAPLAPDVPTLPIASAPWLILTDTGGVGAALAASFAAGGLPAVIVAKGADVPTLLAEAFGSTSPAGVVYLWGLDAPQADVLTAQSLQQAHAESMGGLIGLVQALQAAGMVTAVTIVTQGVQRVTDADRSHALTQAPLWGLGRALAEELPDLRTRLVDLDPAHAPQHAAALLLRELSTGERENQVALRGAERFVARMAPAPAQAVSPPLHLRADSAYLLTGGFGGLGAQVAHRLVTRGARRLILMGRTELPARDQWAALDPESPTGRRVALVRALEQAGASVHVASLDVGDETALGAWLEKYRAEGWPPIRGVVHMAALFDGHLVSELEPETLSTLLRPKVTGAWHLGKLLSELDFFVLYSSVAALLPQPGQGAYAAANAFLDALAHNMAASGRHALSINWGVWVGDETSSSEEYRQRTAMADRLLASRGFQALHTQDGLDTLEMLMQGSLAQAVFAPINAQVLTAAQLARPLPILVELAAQLTLDHAGASEAAAHAISVRTQIESAEPHARLALLESHVRQAAARVLKLQPERLNPAKPFGAMGLDSLMGVELRNRLEFDLGMRLPSTLAWNYPTVNALSKFLLGRLFAAAADKEDAAAGEALAAANDGEQFASLLRDVQEISDDDALRALLEGAEN